MAYIFGTLLALSTTVTQCFPINNGFSVKFNPVAVKDEVKFKSFGALFAKIPQNSRLNVKLRKEGKELTKSYYPSPFEYMGTGCTNQVAKLGSIKGLYDDKNVPASEGLKFINLPIVKQPYDSYKILVASAPANLKLNGEESNRPLVIYIVFGDDGSGETNFINIPSIYFVSKNKGKMEISKKEQAEPILIIDSNRTVTGLKSTKIQKFVNFRNKLARRYQYQISR